MMSHETCLMIDGSATYHTRARSYACRQCGLEPGLGPPVLCMPSTSDEQLTRGASGERGIGIVKKQPAVSAVRYCCTCNRSHRSNLCACKNRSRIIPSRNTTTKGGVVLCRCRAFDTKRRHTYLNASSCVGGSSGASLASAAPTLNPITTYQPKEEYCRYKKMAWMK